LYSFFGILAKISKGFQSQVFHPQSSNISGLLVQNSSQLISIIIFELSIPGTSMIGEHGPSAKEMIFSLIDSDFF